MKRLLVLLIATLGLVSCEKEATPADFLSDEDIELLLGIDLSEDEEEEGILDPPIFIAEIEEVDFIADFQLGVIRDGNKLVIEFRSTIGNTLILEIENPAVGTFTAGRNSIAPFIAQYTIGEGPTYTTDDSEIGLQQSTGTLIITEFNGSEISGTFDFIAYNSDGSIDTVEALMGRFNDAIIIN